MLSARQSPAQCFPPILKTMTNIFNRIIKIGLYSSIFLLPVFWLPFTFEFFEFNKQYLLFFLVSLTSLAWLFKMVLIDREIRFRPTPLDVPILVFLLVAISGALFSLDSISSILGFYGKFYDGLIGLLSLGMLYFLITNNAANETGNKESGLINSGIALKVFLWSTFFAVFGSYLSVFGVWQKILSKAPQFQAISQSFFNPVSASWEGLAIFLSAAVVLLVGLICFSKWNRPGYWILLFLILGLLIVINFKTAWAVLIISAGLFLIFSLYKRIFRKDVNKLLLPIFLIILGTIFTFADYSSVLNSKLPKEQTLGQSFSWKVSWGAVNSNIKSAFIGSGVGTFAFDFTKYKPVEFNQTQWWQVRYDRPRSHIAEIFATMGILGIVFYLILIFIFLTVCWRAINSKTKDSLPLLMAVLALLVGQFFYYQGTALAFSFWLFLALSVAAYSKPSAEKRISFKSFPEMGLVFSTLLFSFAALTIGAYVLAVRFYAADMNFARVQSSATSKEAVEKLQKSIKLNPENFTYRAILARTNLFQILEELRKPIKDQNIDFVKDLAKEAVNQAEEAARLSPNSVAAFETLGVAYEAVQSWVAGAADGAINSFQAAAKLEPTNPVLYTELGKLYLFSDIQKARENFIKAKDLKLDYIDPQIQYALSYEREGNPDQAIKEMEKVVAVFPFDEEANFQLGRLYYNKNMLDEAIPRFENVLKIKPYHSNSLYSLGLIYSKKGDKDKAVSFFEKVLALNPGNEDVVQKLEELNKEEKKK